ncbi:MAG: hypothetical protein HY926_08155 [Elusimicrobia bacterium]|nr:hypothetical protein [Elusimicrobiota bacterium]
MKVERHFGPDPEAYLVSFEDPVRCQARAYLFREHPVTPKGGPEVSIDLYFDDDGIEWVESLNDDQCEHVFSTLTEKFELEGVPVMFMVNFGRPADKMLILSVNCEKEPASH